MAERSAGGPSYTVDVMLEVASRPAPSSLRRSATARLALGLAAAATVLVGPPGFEHRHDSSREVRTHSHVHHGAHRHDVDASDQRARGSPIPGPLPWPQPERDDDAPEGRYVPASGPLAAHRVGVVEAAAHLGPGKRFTPRLPPAALRLHGGSATAPRGPPAC